MVIIKIPYALSYRDESRIYQSWCRARRRSAMCTSTRTFLI